MYDSDSRTWPQVRAVGGLVGHHHNKSYRGYKFCFGRGKKNSPKIAPPRGPLTRLRGGSFVIVWSGARLCLVSLPGAPFGTGPTLYLPQGLGHKVKRPASSQNLAPAAAPDQPFP